MRFDQIAGSVEVYPSDAALMIRSWFHPDDLVYLSGKRTVKIKSKNVVSQGCSARELYDTFNGEGGTGFLSSLLRSDDNTLWDLYINVSPVAKPLSNVSERVREETISHVIGIIADLDVKVSGFDSQNQILDFVKLLPFKPTIAVSTGSGGVHAYWKFSEERTGKVSAERGKDIAARWWSYLDEQAFSNFGAHIDKLTDMARMLRLPGSIRWPKAEETGPASPVRLLWSDGPLASISALTDISSPAWDRRLERVNQTRNKDREKHFDADQLASYVLNSSEDKWARYQAIAHVEDFFNEEISWDDLLTKAGWTKLRKDSQGRVEWARPGRDEKSATVDWPESPHVMSLLSTSHDTGLLDLLDAGIPLTKWRVALRLLWKDEYSDMVGWTLNKMGIGK